MGFRSYLKSIITHLRAGTIDDPFIPITESKKIINNQIQLNEIPSEIHRVQITNFNEVSNINIEELQSDQFIVDYSEGIIQFHPSKEGVTVTVKYQGRGNHYISAHRVWTQENNGQVTETLGEIIDRGKDAIDNLHQVNEVVRNAEEATDRANTAADNANNVAEAINVAEQSRVEAENLRTQQEQQRQSNEQTRKDNEDVRKAAEINRQEAEESRVQAEMNRVDAENEREIAENKRESNEQVRQNNELVRQDQEAARQTNTQKAINRLEEAKSTWAYKGDYNNEVSYVPNNVVSYNGEAYICIKDSTGNLPTNTNYWRKIAAAGSISSVTSSNDDIIVVNPTTAPELTLNTGMGANQIVKRNEEGGIESSVFKLGNFKIQYNSNRNTLEFIYGE